MIERFSTLEIHPRQRLDYWNSLCEKTLSGTVVDTSADSFRATMLHWKLGDLTLLRPRSDASRVWRAPVDGGAGRLVLHIQYRGSGMFSQGRRDASMKAGGFVLTSGNEGYRFALSQDHELIVVEMPLQPLKDRLPQLENYLCTCIHGSPAAYLFQEFVLSLWRHGALVGASAAWEAEICRSFYDMLAMALAHRIVDVDAEPATAGQPLLKHAQAYVESELATMHLSTTQIAEHLNVSVRTVQNLFSLASTTPSNYILERRLLHAADRLRIEPDASITQIAFDLGFNDSAYFSRCFQRKYGLSPRQWRKH